MHLSKISLALRQWGAGAGFSPLDLFSSGEQGAWYDPSDINNYMGPELIVNGTFDSNTDGWTPIYATASAVGGKCVVTNTSNTWGVVTTELQVTVGDIYALSIYFDTTSGYDATVAIPGLLEDGISAGQTITYSATVVADTNPLTLYIGNTDEVVGHNISFDNVSIRRIGEATMFQDNAGTTPVTADGQPVGKILDKSGRGNHASQATAASRPLKTSTGLSKWIDYDAVDDALNVTFPSSLGSNCTVCRANVGGAPTILTGQTIGTSYASSADHAGLIIVNRALTGQETTDVTAWLTAKGATS